MPPVEAHAPMEMTHLGCGIWSYTRRITGASLNGSRPAQISTSAWRGENAWRSMPKRAKSKRLAAVAMNSMAQQAVPNGMGHNELARAQLTRSSSRASSQLGLWPATSLVSMTCFMAPGDASIPFESAPLPDVHVSHEQDGEEDEHVGQQEPHPRSRRPACEVDRAPGDQENCFDVEHDEQHRDQVELDREPLVGVAQGGHAALVGLELRGGGAPRCCEVREADQERGVRRHEHQQQQESDVGFVHGCSPENHPSARGCQPNRVA